MKPFKNYPIKKQFYIILICVLLCSSVLGVTVNATVQNLLLDNKIAYAKATALKFETEITYLFKRITTIYEYFQFESNIENLFADPFTPQMFKSFQDIEMKVLSLSIMNNDIEDIALAGNGIYYSSLFDKQTLESMNKQSGTSSEIISQGIMTSSFFNTSTHPYFVFSRNIFGFYQKAHYGDKLGSMIISIDPSKSSITLPQTPDIDTYFMLADKHFNTYPFNCTQELADKIITDSSQTLDALNASDFDSGPTQIDSKDYIVYVSYIPDMAYYVISAVDKDKLFFELRSTRFLILIILFIVFFFMLLLMKVLLNNVINPLNELYLFIKSIRQGNIKNLKRPISLDGSLEISTLSSEFNRMLGEINLLNKNLFDTTTHLYEIELEKNKAEIAHLRSQINPHFLYNTLESIRGIALENNIPEIATIAVGMGKMFRYSIKGDSTAPLSEELSIVEAYLNIQLIRFDYKFEVFYSIASTTVDLHVPKMILQPLVENAIFYGLENKLDTGTLYIGSIITPDHCLKLTIQDDGVGISEDLLQTLQTTLAHPECSSEFSTSHVGLLNVHNRLRLAYGDAYGIQIDSKECLGTKITLCLPITLKEKRITHA